MVEVCVRGVVHGCGCGVGHGGCGLNRFGGDGLNSFGIVLVWPVLVDFVGLMVCCDVWQCCGGGLVGLVWAFWMVLGGSLCEWWWVLVFCWVCSGCCCG